MTNEITVKTISNVRKVDWIDFFKKNSIKGYTPHLSPASFEPLKRYLNDERFIEIERRKELIDDFIFDYLAFERGNTQYLYEIKDSNITFENQDELTQFFKQESLDFLNLNKSFFNDSRDGDVRIFTSKIYYENNVLENLLLILKVGETTEDSPKNFFVTVNIDFINDFYSVVFSKNSLKYMDPSVGNIIELVKGFLEKKVFDIFQILPKMSNEYTLKKALHHLYTELSDDIERRLESLLPDNMEEVTSEFLEEIDVEFTEKYLKQIIAILFQDKAGLDNAHLYPDGWIFRFLFLDGDCTRASSRTDQLDPIYTSPIYWNLKELIRGAEGLLDVGFVWKTSINGDSVNIYVRLDVINENICIHYYQKGNYKYLKREKENYVRSKIRGVLPKN